MNYQKETNKQKTQKLPHIRIEIVAAGSEQHWAPFGINKLCAAG